MEIKGVGGVSRFPEDKGPKAPELRDPSLEDLPRVMGKEVPREQVSGKVSSILSLILGIGEKHDK